MRLLLDFDSSDSLNVAANDDSYGSADDRQREMTMGEFIGEQDSLARAPGSPVAHRLSCLALQ